MELRLRIQSAGLNFADTLMVAGVHQERREPPFTPGLGICEAVEALGADAEEDWVACFAEAVSLAERACARAARGVRAPAAMPASVAAEFLIAHGTSEVASGPHARLRAGETPLVIGASGGVGLAAVGLGVRIDGDADVRAEVKAPGGADVIYKTVGGATFDAALRAARPEAGVLPIGFAGGPQIPANLLVKNLTVMGLYWGTYASLRPQVLTDSFARLFG